jgi:hypothetical protein
MKIKKDDHTLELKKELNGGSSIKINCEHFEKPAYHWFPDFKGAKECFEQIQKAYFDIPIL